jgi:glutathione synthase
VYFRAGYNPSDYTTPRSYEVRRLLERSLAIKCPSIPLQLAGAKKVQQVLTQPGILERFLCDEEKWGSDHTFGPGELDELRASWMGMWGLDEEEVQPILNGTGPTPVDSSILNEQAGMRKARQLAPSLVLKPQREGGGNNVFKEAIPAFLDALPPAERCMWIAMELIVPPMGRSSYFVRPDGSGGMVRTDVASELGIFGWALFGGAEAVVEREVGWLVRTKGRESNEGGVAAGCSVLDSLLLVDD